LFPAGLGRGFVTMALEDPVSVVNALKLQEGLAHFLYVVESPLPEQVFFEGAHKTLGALPLPSGARTKAMELTIPRKAISDWKSWDIN
jgi:hypothetical protein